MLKLKFLKLDINYILKQGSWTSVHFVLSSVLSFILQLIVVNTFSKLEYGNYQYVFAISGMIMSFSLQGLRIAMIRNVSQGDLSSFPIAVKILGKFSLLLIGAHFVVALYYLSVKDFSNFVLFSILSITAPTISLYNTYTGYLQGVKDFRGNAIYQVVSLILTTIASVLTLLIHKNIIMYVFVAQGVNLIVNYFIHRKLIRQIPSIETTKTEQRNLLRYGLHLSAAGTLGSWSLYFDKIILNHYGGPISVAILAISSSLINRAKLFTKSISIIILPKIAEKNIKSINGIFHLRTLQGLALGLACAAALYFVTPVAFRILYPKYAEDSYYAQILAFEAVFLFVGAYHSAILKAHNMLKPLYVITTTNGIIRILFLFVGAMMFSTHGVVLARVCSSSISGLVVYIYLGLHLKKQKRLGAYSDKTDNSVL